MKELKPAIAIAPFVKTIFLLEDKDTKGKTSLPFYADGYPGIAFRQSEGDAFLQPKKKKLSTFFLYGQTLKPIKIELTGAYRLIVFQLHPFASKILIGVNPKELNDDCYNLELLNDPQVALSTSKLFRAKSVKEQTKIITQFLLHRAKQSSNTQEAKIQLAINLIILQGGRITVKALTNHLHTTERTLQRLFNDYVGISPKQFAQIIQFQSSFDQISKDNFSKLTDIVYQTGYADQSHFIRTFKKYVGKTPKAIKNKK